MIYFDMNIYNRIFDDQSQNRIRLETEAINMIFNAIDQNKYSLLWSFVLEDENNRNPFLERRSYIKILSKSCKAEIEPSDGILEAAKNIMFASNTKAKDSLHIACAVEYGARYFLTCDDDLIKKLQSSDKKWNKNNIKVYNPIDFVRNEVV